MNKASLAPNSFHTEKLVTFNKLHKFNVQCYTLNSMSELLVGTYVVHCDRTLLGISDTKVDGGKIMVSYLLTEGEFFFDK